MLWIIYYHGLAILGFLVASIIIATSALQLLRMVRFYHKSHSSLRARLTRFGGYLAHMGIGLCLVGLIGSSMYAASSEYLMVDNVDKRFAYEGYVFEYKGGEQITLENGNTIDRAEFNIYDNSGHYLGSIFPGVEKSALTMQQKALPTTLFSPLNDIYMVYDGRVLNTEDFLPYLSLTIAVNPLISVLWTGFGFLLAGALLAAFATRRSTEHAREKNPLKDNEH
jgi:cytochrome c-type biogenesis protein CcmF